MGMGVLLTSATLGLVWRYLLRFRNKTPRWYSLYGFGVIVHAAMLLWILALPPQLRSDVFKNISLPVMLIYPLGTVLLGLLLIRQRQQNEWEQELRQERDLIAQISKTSLDAILLTSTDGSIEAANPAACRMFGRTEEEIVRIGRSGIVDTTDPRLSLALEERARSGSFIGELTFIRKEGQKFPGEVASASFKDKEGRERISMIIRDISARKQAEATQHQLEEKFYKAFHISPDSININRLKDGLFIDVNEGFTALTGYSAGEAVGKTSLEINLWADPQDRELLVAGLRERGEMMDLEASFRIKNGQLRRCLISARILEIDGEMCILSVTRDITERAQVEEALQKISARHTSMIENIGDVIGIIGSDGLMKYKSPNIERWFGWKPEDLVGTDGWKMVHPEDIDRIQKEFNLLLENDHASKTVEYRYKCKDGSYKWVELTAVNRIIDSDINGILLNYHDITERKQTEKLLRQQSDQVRLLYEASQQLNRTLNLNDIYQAICDLMSTVAPNDGLIISAFDPETQLITCRAYWLENKWLDVSPFPSIPLEAEGKGTQSRVIHSGQSMLINDYEAYQKTASAVYYVDGETNEVNQDTLSEEDITRSALIVPLKNRGRVTGVIQVASYRLNAYTENQLKLLESLALHISSAEQNALLYAQVQIELNERKQTEKSLRDSEEKYRTLIEQLPAMVFLDNATIEGHTLYVSPQIETILGFTPQEWLESSPGIWSKQAHPDDLERVHAAYMRCFLNGELFEEEYRIYASDGRLKWFHDQAKLLRDETGKPYLILGVTYDITEHKQAEEAIHQRVTELEMLYQSGLELGQLLNPKEIGQKILELLKEKLGWQHTGILFYHLQDDNPEMLDFSQFGQLETMEHLKPILTRFMSNWAIQQGKPVRTGDVNVDPRFIESYSGIRSGLYVPMKLGEHIVGVISVEDEQPDAFSEADERLIATLANQAANAFENARLFEEIRKRVLELETLNRISLVLRSVSKQNEMLSIVLDEALDILNTSHGSIELYNKTTDTLDKIITRGWLAQVIEPLHKIGDGIAGKVFTNSEIYISREFASDPQTRAASVGQTPPNWGGICLPIRTTQQTLGVMIVSVPSEHELSKDEIRLLSILSELIGAALQRMQLHEQTVRRLEQLNALRAVDQAIAGNLDMRLTLHILLTHTISQLGVDAADVLLLHSDSNLLELAAGQGFHTLLFESVNLSASIAGRAVMEHQMIALQDFETANLNPSFGKFWQDEGFACYWCVPLIVKGEVKGVLEVYRHAALTPDSEWLEFLETLAGQAAIAIDNAQLFENLQRANLDLSLAYDATIEGWSRAMDLRDHETEGHTLRVTDLTLKLARDMRVSESQLTAIRRGALLHDIGKMGIPDSILLKPGVLNEREWEIMHRHPEYAYDMLTPIDYLRPALDIPYYHHEKWDGTGYPRGLKGEEIPFVARIFAIVDVWDALTNERPYRPAWSKEKTLGYIHEQNGKHFDPKVVDAFLKLLNKSLQITD